MGGNVGNIAKPLLQFFSTTSVQRAVEAQAKVTGGALNTAAQSSVQADKDRVEHKRQNNLLGHGHAVDAAAALEPTHTATGEDARSPTERRDYRRRKGGDGQRGKQRGKEQNSGRAPDWLEATEASQA